MSKQHTGKIRCPKCGKESDFAMWDSINTMLDPEMKEKVRTGEAFRFYCPDCGVSTEVNYSCLYHQMEDHVMIYLVPGEKEKTAETMKRICRNDEGGIIEKPLKLHEDYRNRVVGSLNELKEKLLILDEGLDDKAVEIAKIYVLARLMQMKSDTGVQLLLFDKAQDGHPLFSLLLEGGKWASIDFPREMYDWILETFGERIDSDKEVIIDHEWAMAFLTQGQ